MTIGTYMTDRHCFVSTQRLLYGRVSGFSVHHVALSGDRFSRVETISSPAIPKDLFFRASASRNNCPLFFKNRYIVNLRLHFWKMPETRCAKWKCCHGPETGKQFFWTLSEPCYASTFWEDGVYAKSPLILACDTKKKKKNQRHYFLTRFEDLKLRKVLGIEVAELILLKLCL